ncbi:MULTISPECIES: carbamoyltransferase HypF [Thiorhodovibrio]|uniref:carbamoyltransferase HypF n=1 Tax=Thiorhodovibrio TaxID=61593 RepID=UPI001913F20E|nr:carbamoyltransferase HypF [Thiorhodovibrio litoralis]MBK5967661.1 carbamoyltransferase HypF [Thiorhodovibrio winogradskyi]WPL11609.1 Carbamoyltransferase HypF [Thiorhodovibrio litoralis]
MNHTQASSSLHAEQVRVRGLVQGVGFRPHVWHLANSLGCRGDVRNDGDGVLIRLWAPDSNTADTFCHQLSEHAPPLARIDRLERAPLPPGSAPPAGETEFKIIASAATEVHTAIVPDAATCAACAAEIAEPANRRYRYPFTNCTHCGPRLSILRAIPYDRANTSMAAFPMCPDCQAEYDNPANRRFHAQPNACPVCGPRVWLEDTQGQPLAPPDLQAVDAIALASRLLAAGQIIAIKGIGGFHLACDATNTEAVTRLRQRKARDAKPFALMARDIGVIRHYCQLSEQEAILLQSPAAPIVLLARKSEDHNSQFSSQSVSRGDGPPQDMAPKLAPKQSPNLAPKLAPGIAPRQHRLGVMLPYSPVHLLLLADWDRPLVMTSGNRSDEPQAIANEDARERLAPMADALLLHDRDIINRIDDSLARVDAGHPRLLRRARGYSPAPLLAPEGFDNAAPILALGGELKNTFCLLDAPRLILSQHLGDLDEPATLREFERTLALYRDLFQHRPQAIAVDLHPDYRSSAVGRRLAAELDAPLIQVQHHHAHIAAVLADNGWPKDAGPVLGIALDGLGYCSNRGSDGGSNGHLWGGELLRADYHSFTRLAWLRPTPLPGSDRAAREPWRNLLAQLHTAFGWQSARDQWPWLNDLPGLAPGLTAAPIDTLLRMIDNGFNAPLSSSTGRLFDAVAAALGICPERLAYEGQAAMELEALASGELGNPNAQAGAFSKAAPDATPQDPGYPFALIRTAEGTQLDPAPMWQALLDDLSNGITSARIAASFHTGFAKALTNLAVDLAREQHIDTLALSGGSFQNRILLETVIRQAEQAGMRILTHRQVPANDGGIALGQALIAAANLETASTQQTDRTAQRHL